MIRMVAWIALLAGGCYVCLCLYLYVRQRSLLYFPHPPSRCEDAAVHWLHNHGQRLKIWTVERGGGPALIYFGGNAEDVSQNIPFFKQTASQYSLFLMNYRGFGGSSGNPSEAGLYADGLALYDWIRTQHRRIVVMGRSLGTGIATYLASKREIAGLVLVTPYSSITALAAAYYPFMPVAPLLKDRYESFRRAPDITVPVLVMTAEHDEVIPRRISDELIGSFQPGIAENLIISGTGHNTIEQSAVYRSRLQQFLAGLIKQLEGEET
ncbi:MAG: alpha/beta hydrolase [Desulfofustis sp.]|nr:alpha/beta hydrolase [Desulfofustis sp.]